MSSEQPVPTAQPGGRRRGVGSVLDMVRSLAVVLVLIGAIAFLTFRPTGGDEVRVVEYEDTAASARVAAPYDVLVPAGLDGYRATSVRYGTVEDETVWHLGFVSPDDEYVGLDQTDGAAEPFVDTLTEGASPVGDGPVTLGTRAWVRYDGGGDDPDERVRGLVAEEPGVTTVVSGTAGWAELEAMAAALTADG